jgi:hypothetical protein
MKRLFLATMTLCLLANHGFSARCKCETLYNVSAQSAYIIYDQRTTDCMLNKAGDECYRNAKSAYDSSMSDLSKSKTTCCKNLKCCGKQNSSS